MYAEPYEFIVGCTGVSELFLDTGHTMWYGD